MNAIKRSATALCALLMLSSSTACYSTTVHSGQPANPARIDYDARWHNGVIWGIAELSGPYNLKKICPHGWAEVKTETSFLAGLLYAVTSGIYAPQTVTVRCSGSEDDDNETQPEGATDEEAAASPLHQF